MCVTVRQVTPNEFFGQARRRAKELRERGKFEKPHWEYLIASIATGKFRKGEVQNVEEAVQSALRELRQGEITR